MSSPKGAKFRKTSAFVCDARNIFVCNYFRQKYWIGAPKTRAKITIFQTPVFQLFISLLYRRAKEHIAPRPLRLCVKKICPYVLLSKQNSVLFRAFCVRKFFRQRGIRTYFLFAHRNHGMHRNFASHVLRMSASSSWDITHLARHSCKLVSISG